MAYQMAQNSRFVKVKRILSNDLHLSDNATILSYIGNKPYQTKEKTMNTYKNEQGDIICSIHMDLSVMNAHNECEECLDDAHEAEILAR